MANEDSDRIEKRCADSEDAFLDWRGVVMVVVLDLLLESCEEPRNRSGTAAQRHSEEKTVLAGGEKPALTHFGKSPKSRHAILGGAAVRPQVLSLGLAVSGSLERSLYFPRFRGVLTENPVA